MKINRMWAMFDTAGGLFKWSIMPLRVDVIEKVEKNYGLKWAQLYKPYGFRIEKVVVLRAEDFEELLAEKGGER